MSPELQQQYLQAMGIQLWQSRHQSVAQPVELSVPAVAEEPVITTEQVTLTPDQIPQDQALSDWSLLESTVRSCVACELHQSRSQTVIAEGSDSAALMIVSTAPALNAEFASSLLSADSSLLLSNMLKAIDIQRSDIYFTSLLKCQLPAGQALRTTAVLCCEPYLNQQIDMVKPDLIVALGEVTAQQLVVSKKTLPELRGKVYQYQSVPLMVMSHPDELLLKPETKRQAWHDLLQIKQKLSD
ncbi:MAG: uracil-DNA glycosylase [Gammaproteobacteria bacterium]|nr:uracil-DNA glycosylase [Gammaproteobacteria bacterium]